MITPKLDYRVDRFADMYLLLRTLAGHDADADDDWQEAIEIVRAVTRDVGFFDGMAIDAVAASSRSIEGLRASTFRPADMTRLADAVGLIAPIYEPLAGEREAMARRAVGSVAETLGPRESEALGYIIESLDVRSAPSSIPVYVAVDVPWPGAFTSGADANSSACFVSASLDALTLAEIILHEATHVLEHWIDPESALLDLDRAVDKHRLAPQDQLTQLSHAVIFVQAAETVRRYIDPSYTDYGYTHAYYERVPCSLVVRKNWLERLSGAIDTRTAVDRIISEAFP